MMELFENDNIPKTSLLVQLAVCPLDVPRCFLLDFGSRVLRPALVQRACTLTGRHIFLSDYGVEFGGMT